MRLFLAVIVFALTSVQALAQCKAPPDWQRSVGLITYGESGLLDRGITQNFWALTPERIVTRADIVKDERPGSIVHLWMAGQSAPHVRTIAKLAAYLSLGDAPVQREVAVIVLGQPLPDVVPLRVGKEPGFCRVLAGYVLRGSKPTMVTRVVTGSVGSDEVSEGVFGYRVSGLDPRRDHTLVGAALFDATGALIGVHLGSFSPLSPLDYLWMGPRQLARELREIQRKIGGPELTMHPGPL